MATPSPHSAQRPNASPRSDQLKRSSDDQRRRQDDQHWPSDPHKHQYDQRWSRDEEEHSGRSDQLRQGLGWFSACLGAVAVASPNSVTRFLGVDPSRRDLVRLIGLRELANGVGLLSQRSPEAFSWMRVAGDAMDLSLLGVALAGNGTHRQRAAWTAAALGGVTALDILSSVQATRDRTEDAVRLTQAILVQRSPEDLYRSWRKLENLPSFMEHLESVTEVEGAEEGALPTEAASLRGSYGGARATAAERTRDVSEGATQSRRRSHWVAKPVAGQQVEWTAEIVEDRPGERISWRTVDGADVPNAGTVFFERAPGDRGTLVTVEMSYEPPAGAIGLGVAKLLGQDPESRVREDLRRFKRIMETGDLITTQGQPSGRTEEQP